jgi:antitoxin VapB
MPARTAKLFTTGRSQAVRLPIEFRFEGKEVFIRRDPRTGDVILSRKPETWEGLFELYSNESVLDDFMGADDRRQPPQDRDPFDGEAE